jgi:hypothetical protein
MNSSRTILLTMIAALCLPCVSCLQKQIAGGTDTETGGTVVAGSIRKSDGTPAPNTVVALIPTDYNPAADAALPGSLTDTTKADGFYAITVPKKGRYNIQAVNLVSRNRLLLLGVDCEESPVNVPTGSLTIPGSVRLSLPDVIDAVNGYCYIPGTSLFVRLRAKTDFVDIDSVPTGIMPSIVYGSFNSSAATILRYSVAVNTGDTARVYNPGWKFSRHIILNTSASGAGVSGTVVDFPVLIRLCTNDFDLSQMQPGGADIRFTKPDNAFLFHEIERWDASVGHAEIWVKIDTMRGDDSVQSITMYWGNPAASDSSRGGAVFDTANGFQGVWHLGDAKDDSVRDATANRYHGASPDTARPSIAEGIIGNCRVFNGNGTYITMPNTADGRLNFPQNGSYTVSAWVSIDTFNNAPQLIVSKGYEQYFLRSTYFPSKSWEFVEFDETTNWQSSRSPGTNRQWTLLTGVRQGSMQFLYCNGVLADSAKDVWPNQGNSRNTSNDLSIGGFLKEVTIPENNGYCFFKGSIDEVRILSAAQSPEWVRLCYMNQRADDRLIVYKK